jgi:hypothetical protein
MHCELSPNTRICCYYFEDISCHRVSCHCDSAASSSGLAHASLLLVNDERNPTFKMEVDHRLSHEGCKFKVLLVRLFISSKFYIYSQQTGCVPVMSADDSSLSFPFSGLLMSSTQNSRTFSWQHPLTLIWTLLLEISQISIACPPCSFFFLFHPANVRSSCRIIDNFPVT